MTSVNIPSLVNNIENNIDMYGNIPNQNNGSLNNQNITYNPNIIPNDGPLHNGPLHNGPVNNGPVNNGQFSQMSSMQQMPQNNFNLQNQIQGMQNQLQMMQKNSVINNIETMGNSNSRGILSTIKSSIYKILIYTVIFIILNHSLAVNLVNNIPGVNYFDSNVPNIAFRGLLQAFTIIILHYFIKLD